MPSQSVDRPVPITLITGFLGAGKTTLLNRILNADHGLRAAVLVNDFGAINIDSQLVAGVEGETISLANGCICCTIRDDLLHALLALLERPEQPEYILVETSGVSDPEAVALTFLLPELRPYLRLDSILTVIDGEQVLNLCEADSILAEAQIAVADIVILNKWDLCSEAQRAEVVQWVQLLSPRARMLPAVQGDVPLELLLGVGAFDPERIGQRPAHDVHVHEQRDAAAAIADPDHAPAEAILEPEHQHAHHDHSLVYDSWSYVTDAPLDFKAFRAMIRQIPHSIFRAKGVLYFADAPLRRGLLHVVGKRVRLSVGVEWGETRPGTQVVVIGRAGAIDPAALTAAFEGCLAQQTIRPDTAWFAQPQEFDRQSYAPASANP